MQSRPFSFLTNIGGKETAQARVTLRTGPGMQGAGAATMPPGTASFLAARHKHTASKDEAPEEEDGERLAIFTNMDVDKHDHDSK